jgi:hypothetical protein
MMADVKTRAVILLLKDTGLRVSELTRLNVGDADLDSEFPLLTVTPKKQQIKRNTVLGPESQEALKTYLKSRRSEKWSNGEKIPGENMTAKAPLFRQNTVMVKRMSANAFSASVGKLIKQVGMGWVSALSFRRFFKLSLELSGVPLTWLDHILGYQPSGTRKDHREPTDTELREAYIHGYDFLRIDEAPLSEAYFQQLEEWKGEIETKTHALSEAIHNAELENQRLETLINNVKKTDAELEEQVRRMVKELCNEILGTETGSRRSEEASSRFRE